MAKNYHTYRVGQINFFNIKKYQGIITNKFSKRKEFKLCENWLGQLDGSKNNLKNH
jgi:hypothetical protein